MPATEAALGYLSKFGIKDGATYDYVAEVVSITPPGMSRDTVDVTHLQSSDKFKEYIAGLADGGPTTISVNYKPETSDVLLAAFIAETGDFQVLFPSGTKALQFEGIVTAWEPGELTADGAMSCTFTVKPTGPVFLVTVTP